MAAFLRKAWLLYRDAFKNQTWGRPLIWLVVLKFFILFAILRVFFFKPAMAGLDEAERSRVVGERLVGGSQTETETPASPSQTYNL